MKFHASLKQNTTKKYILNAVTFYLEDDNNEEVNFNGETLTFTSQMIKIWTIKWAFKNVKLLVIALGKNYIPAQKT